MTSDQIKKIEEEKKMSLRKQSEMRKSKSDTDDELKD